MAEVPDTAATSRPPDASSAVAVRGMGACPAPAAVWAELGTLIPHARLTARLAAAGGAGAPIEVFDLGAAYRVVAGGPAREYRDEGRDCGERARVAALFIALAIDPAEVMAARAPAAAGVGALAGSPAPPPAVAVVAAPPAGGTTPAGTGPAPAAPSPRARLRLQVGGAVDAGLASGGADTVVHAGAAVRVAAGAGRLALAVGALVLAPVETGVGGVRLRQWRLPADAGVRGRLAGRVVEAYGELGVSAILITERALDTASAATRSAVEVGARGALGLHWIGVAGSRVASFAAVHAAIVPGPASIFVLPRGVVGHAPYFWVGATLGLSVGLVR